MGPQRTAYRVPGFAGQGLGMIRKIRTAAAGLQDLVQGAEQALGSASGLL